MKRSIPFTLAALLALALPLAGQTSLVRGDVVVSGYEQIFDDTGFPLSLQSNLRVYGRDGVYKRELVSPDGRFFGEPMVRDGIVYFGARTPDAIERVAADGTHLEPFTTDVVDINYLSPGPAGGILAANVGEMYQFAADGTLIHFRDITDHPNVEGGVDLGRDGCTVFYSTSGALARWDACLDSEATFFTPRLGSASYALRVLPGGTFLAAFATDHGSVFHLDREGNVIREYPIPSPHGVALDIDGTSFWTNAGNLLLHVDIATGAVLSETFTPYQIYGISVVGEPRAGLAGTQSIPALSPLGLIGLAMAISILAAVTLRIR
jgi:hypothetical protein